MANNQLDKETLEKYLENKSHNTSFQKYATENSEEKKDSQVETEATFSVLDSLNKIGGIRVDKTASFKNLSIKEL